MMTCSTEIGHTGPHSVKYVLADSLLAHQGVLTDITQDVCWSLYVGREFGVPLPSGEHKIPVPFVDASYDQIPWHYPPSNIPPQPNNLSMTFAAYCELLVIARRVHDVVYVFFFGLHKWVDG